MERDIFSRNNRSGGKDREIDAAAYYSDIVFFYSSRWWDTSEHQLVLRAICDSLELIIRREILVSAGFPTNRRRPANPASGIELAIFILGALQRERDAKSRGCRENTDFYFPFLNLDIFEPRIIKYS